jgi:serine/threonine protein phosphatase PrpC
VKLKWGATTDVGMVRQQNEDDFCAEENLFVVADGMGGHNAGEVATSPRINSVNWCNKQTPLFIRQAWTTAPKAAWAPP